LDGAEKDRDVVFHVGKAAHSVRDTLIRPSGTFSRKREKGVQ